jgi:aconitate hydratase
LAIDSDGVLMSVNSFDAQSTLQVGEDSYQIFRLDAVDGSDRLPYSLKILLENLLRT